MMIDVQENYKKWLELAKRQRFFVNSTFTKTAIAPVYEKVLAVVSESVDKLPKPVQLNMPSLPKLELPTLKKL
jgi:hypothetical protein